jgi:hypothetical protein
MEPAERTCVGEPADPQLRNISIKYPAGIVGLSLVPAPQPTSTCMRLASPCLANPAPLQTLEDFVFQASLLETAMERASR